MSSECVSHDLQPGFQEYIWNNVRFGVKLELPYWGASLENLVQVFECALYNPRERKLWKLQAQAVDYPYFKGV